MPVNIQQILHVVVLSQTLDSRPSTFKQTFGPWERILVRLWLTLGLHALLDVLRIVDRGVATVLVEADVEVAEEAEAVAET